MWFVFALGSALFAALTSILAKVGIEGVNSTLATAIRTVVVLAMSWGMVFLTRAQGGMGEISRRSWLFLILSGLATGASWLCYYRALQLGRASQVVPSSPPAPCLWCCKRVSSLQTTRPSRVCLGGPFVLVSGWYLLPEPQGGGTWPAYPAPASARC